jgi:GNAT superfamily N-acetyltransferase
MSLVEILPSSPDLWPAIADLFAAGGDPKTCWCQFWRKSGSSWTHATPDDLRADLRGLIGRDPAPGLVALRDGVAVGWVGLGPREEFPRLARSRTIPQLPGDGVWVVNCFVVAKAARRSGVARALLDAAVEYARAHGATILEGYPVDTGGARMSSSAAYTGTTGMFRRAGFEVASPTTSEPAPDRPRVVVRRTP